MSYIIVWKYRTTELKQHEFERTYKNEGTWSQFFSASKDYRGSFLYRSEKENIYLLIDAWSSEEAYEKFKTENRQAYDRLSSQFEHLYDSEEKVGGFFDLVGV